MKVKIKYTLTLIQEDNSENWDDPIPQTSEELLQRIKDYVKEDMGYILDSDDFKLEKVEIVE